MKVLVVNPGSPELNELTDELNHRQLLAACVHSYVAGKSSLDTLLMRLPGMRHLAYKNISRRQKLQHVDPSKIRQPVALFEIIRVLLSRNLPPSEAKDNIHHQIFYIRNRMMSKAAKKYLRRSDVVVAAHGTALEVFQEAKKCGTLCVLNFPIAHPAYMRDTLKAEALSKPKFACTLQHVEESKNFTKRYDDEIALADKILVGSDFVKRSFMSQGISSSKLHVAPYGVNIDRFSFASEAPPSTKFRVLFVGQIGQRKGISYLLEAYKAFQSENTELMLVGQFVGNPEPVLEYGELFQHIRNVPNTEIAGLMRQASVLVLPTLVEGMGLVVVEAMASGVPVIVTDCGPGEVVRNGLDGFIVPVSDSAAIVSALRKLQMEPHLRDIMGKAASQRAREFTWKSYTSKVCDFLQDTVRDELGTTVGNVALSVSVA